MLIIEELETMFSDSYLSSCGFPEKVPLKSCDVHDKKSLQNKRKYKSDSVRNEGMDSSVCLSALM